MNVKRWTALLVVGLLLQACAAPAIKPLQAQVEANLPLSAIAYDPQTGTELYTRHAAYSDQLMPGGTAQLRIDRPAGRFVDYLGPSELVLQPDQPLTIRLVYVY